LLSGRPAHGRQEKLLPLWRAEWYGGSQHRTEYVAAASFEDAARLIQPLVTKTLSDGEQQPSVTTVRHGDVHFA
jgi:hypothetical protein